MESSEEHLNAEEALSEDVVHAAGNYVIENSATATEGVCICDPNGSGVFLLLPPNMVCENEQIIYVMDPNASNPCNSSDPPNNPDDKDGSSAIAVQGSNREESVRCCFELDIKSLQELGIQKNSEGELVMVVREDEPVMTDQLPELTALATTNITANIHSSSPSSDAVSGSETKHEETVSASKKPFEVQLTISSLEPQLEEDVMSCKVDETENMPEETESVPEETESVPEETGNISEETGNISEETENMPEEAENMPEEAENILEEAENILEEAENMPEEAENIPEEAENIPEEAENIPEEAENIPEEAENIPEETENNLEKTEDMPEETVDMPEETVDMPEETVDMPEETEDISEETEDISEETENMLEKTEPIPEPVENSPQVVHSPFSSSFQLVDNALSVIHAAESKEDKSRKLLDSDEVFMKNPSVDSGIPLTPNDFSSLTDSISPSEEENSPLDMKLQNQESKSPESRSKDNDIDESGIYMNGSDDEKNNEMEVDMNDSFSSPEVAEKNEEESCNGTENCTEVTDFNEERTQDDSNPSDLVSNQSTHVGELAKEDQHSNSSSHNADCSETDVDTKMDVSQDRISMESETCNSKFSDKELISENFCGSKVNNEHENTNELQFKEERNSFQNISELKNSSSVPSTLHSEDSQSRDEIEDKRRARKSTRLCKSKKSKSDAYEFESGSSQSETSSPKENVDSQTSISKPDPLSVQEKVDDSKLTFLGALDSTDTTLMDADCLDCNDVDDTIDDHKSRDSFHTFGSTDETKSLSDSPTSENPVNGISMPDSEDKASSEKELEGVTEASSMEEITVKVPKKTYLNKRRLNLLKVSENGSGSEKTSPDLQGSSLFKSPDPKGENSIDVDLEDDFISDLKNRVSATYKRRKRSRAPAEQPVRTQNLRPRYSQSLENGTVQTEEILNGIAQKEAEKDDESVHWGDYLSRTSFQTVQKDEPPVTKMRKKRVIFSSLAENNKLSWYKNRIKCGKQWDKLIKSSPYKVKTHGIDKRKLREKIKKQSLSLLNSKKFKLQLTKNLDAKKRGRPKKFNSVPAAVHLVPKVVKRCDIKYLGNNPSETDLNALTQSTKERNTECVFNCLNCEFATDSPHMISRHFALCCLSHKNKAKIDYSVNDMAKQRIRGEHSKDDEDPRCSRARNELYQESEDEDSRKALSTAHIFKPKEIVWAELKKRFWPALLWELEDSYAFVYLIPSIEGFKLPVNRLKSFNDSERNKRYLEEAENLPNVDDFVKAVQISNSYARKRSVLEERLNAKDFFNIPEDVKFLSDIDCNTSSTDSSSASSTVIEEFDGESTQENKEDSEEVDMEALVREELEREELERTVVDIVECILNGKCNEHVVGIFRDQIPSERHKFHQQLLLKKDAEVASQLKNMSWFRPIGPTTQMRLYEYLYDVFKEKVGNESKKSKEDMISYIYEVWMPEAVIKAISMIKNTTLFDAEIIFYKQETRSESMEVDS